MTKTWIYFSFTFLLAATAVGQSLLEKKISVTYKHASLEYVINDLHQQFGLRFSYSSSLLLYPSKVSIHVENESIKKTLCLIFMHTPITFEEKAGQIILHKNQPTKNVTQHSNLLSPAASEQAPLRATDSLDDKIVHPVVSTNKDSITSPSGKNHVDTPTVVVPEKSYDSIPSLDNRKQTNSVATFKHKNNRYHRLKNVVLIDYAKGNYNSTQTAVLLNVGRKVKGSQIGLINIAHSVSGVQIGLLNICKNGYRKIELWSSSSGLKGNVSFKTGTSKLYNIFAAGLNSDSDVDDFNWGLGYGLGSTFNMGKQKCITIDNVVYQLGDSFNRWPSGWNLLNQFRVNIGYQIHKRLCVFLGPELNIRWSNEQQANALPPDNDHDRDDPSTKTVHPNTFQKSTHAKYISAWMGISGGIRF